MCTHKPKEETEHINQVYGDQEIGMDKYSRIWNMEEDTDKERNEDFV